MKTAKLDDMVKGWFIGNFTPTLYATNEVEAAIKRYRAGDKEAKHYHKIATEFTAVVSGRIRMNGKEFSSGDIVILKPNEAADFEAIEDTVTAVVKIPGANDDKYLC